MAWQALAGAGMNLLGGYLGGKAQEKAAGRANQASQAAINQAIADLEALGYPTEEALKIVLETPELLEEYQALNLQDSAIEDISLDPRYQEAKMSQLDELTRISEAGGLTEEDRLRIDQALEEADMSEQARQKGIMNTMAQQGMLDSGASLIAKLQSNAQSSEDAKNRARDLALSSVDARRDAIAKAANVAGNMQSSDYNRAFDKATAKDVISKYNTTNQQGIANRNVDLRQRYADLATDTKNRQQALDRDALTTSYGYASDQARDKANLRTKGAVAQSNYELGKGERRAGMYKGAAEAGTGIMDYFGTKKA